MTLSHFLATLTDLSASSSPFLCHRGICIGLSISPKDPDCYLVKKSCGHIFHRDCINRHFEALGERSATCLDCRERLDRGKEKKEEEAGVKYLQGDGSVARRGSKVREGHIGLLKR